MAGLHCGHSSSKYGLHDTGFIITKVSHRMALTRVFKRTEKSTIASRFHCEGHLLTEQN